MTEEIVNRLTSEGKLIRNSGKHSIKSVKEVLTENGDRFETVFETLNKEVMKQSVILEGMMKLQVKAYGEEKKARQDAERRARLKSTEETNMKPGPVSTSPVFTGRPGNGDGGLNLFGGLFDSLTGFIAGASLAGMVSKIVRGGLFLAIAPFVGSFVEKMVEEGLEALSFDSTMATDIASGIGSAFQWGIVGRIFGRKFAAIFAVGSVLYDHILNGIDPDGDGIVEAFGKEFNADTMAKIGAIFASALGYAVISKAIKGALFGKAIGAASTGALKPTLATAFSNGLVKKMGISGIIYSAGELIGEGIKSVTGSEELGNAVSTTTKFVAAGALFGVHGALVGAIAGIAFTGANWLLTWFREKDATIEERLKKRLDGMGADELLDSVGKPENLLPAASNNADSVAERLKNLDYDTLLDAATDKKDDITGNIPTALMATFGEKILDQAGMLESFFDDDTITNEEKAAADKIMAALRGLEERASSFMSDENLDEIRDYIESASDEYEKISRLFPADIQPMSSIILSTPDNILSLARQEQSDLMKAGDFSSARYRELTSLIESLTEQQNTATINGGSSVVAPVTNNSTVNNTYNTSTITTPTLDPAVY